ncbi:O-antigen ligase family protein [Dyadobacter sp. CY107]|uniref:O-antigen ligase family protein n=1 Tax=Dyadobacter fanqingshengii TaxID=2906443 RepID=UPI001F21EEC0|nr:O-antigen ligase family protein [Dyadobacter fanqingshengii]MCF2504915.1 O-antigen ligase family protein [Dyadobacter fanqingshengii]
MEKDLQLFISNSNAAEQTFKGKLRKLFLVDKMSNTTGLLILLLLSAGLGALIAYQGIIAGALIIVLMIGPPFVYAIVVFPQFGITVLLMLAYLLFFVGRLGIDFPLGTVMDGIQGLLILGFFIRQKRDPNWTMFKGPIGTMILIWILYNITEVANPVAESRLAWVYTIRAVAIVMLTYFVFMYQIRTVQQIRFLLKMWIGLSTFAALYAFKQEFIGFSAAEEAWLYSDPNIKELLFISGHWRKFSIFSDPVAFSYNMVVSSILCIALLSYVKERWKKVVLASLTVIMFTAMLFSGTRGAYVLLPAAMVLFVILKFNRQVLIGTAIAGVGILFLIMVPTTNSNIVRFQTAFKPNEDISFQARKNNQKRIQPYILSHPMGGGLGATGAWGQRFAPQSYLANFPPDSGYVRIAVELGWIGLAIFCLLMFFILREGINNYFFIRNPELKTYCMAMLLIVFAYNIGNYPQEALVQFPSNIYFYLAVAIINITRIIDDKEQARNAKLPARPEALLEAI